jgi:hypothetical protein
MSEYVCILCGSPASAETHPRADENAVTCPICGEYDIEGSAHNAFKRFEWGRPDQRYLLSARARTAPLRGEGLVRVTMKMLGDASRGELREPSFQEKRDSLLDWIAHRSRNDPRSAYGAKVPLDPTKDYPVAWCHDLRDGKWDEWNFIEQQLREKGLMDLPGNGLVRITNAGWEYLEARPKASGSQGFVAIAFRAETKNASDAIEKGIETAGYKAVRIDKQEYIGGVMDEIKARIRESRFVVADLTFNRGGVYHEAGFALGRDIPVILTCRADHLKDDPERNIEKVHFDVQHLNLITWTDDDLADLTNRVRHRIEAVFGHGPVEAAPARGT